VASRTQEWLPEDLGVKNVNLKVGTTYPTGLLDLREYTDFMLAFLVDNTGGGAAGVAKLTAEIYAKDGSTLLLATDILTAINLTADRNEILTFGRSFAGRKIGNGTLGTDIDSLRVLGKVKFIVNVTTPSDATTCVGNLHLKAKK
jgi:hypothetical protein